MATTTLVTSAPANHQNGLQHTGVRAVPVGFDYATVTIQCTTGNPASPFTGFAHPFNSAAMSIEFGAEWSWDGGATFPERTGGIQNGSPTGIWATDRQGNPVMVPDVSISIPSIQALGGLPTHYRAGFRVLGGPITFGYTVTETTG